VAFQIAGATLPPRPVPAAEEPVPAAEEPVPAAEEPVPAAEEPVPVARQTARASPGRPGLASPMRVRGKRT
jgi:hypothetical protein